MKDILENPFPDFHEPHPNMVTGIGDVVQCVDMEGNPLPDVGIVIGQSAHDWNMWRVHWTCRNVDADGIYHGVREYETWTDTGDLWVIREEK